MEKIIYNKVDEAIYYEKLPNGLEVYMYPNNMAKNFYITFSARFGSLDTEFKLEGEKSYRTTPHGTAHFLEHQLFQEDDGHTAFEDFSQLGSSVNAFTSYNVTCYEVTASKNFKENLEILLNYVQNPVFKTQSVNAEKGIIKEEISMYENTPGAVLNFGLENNLNIKDKHKYTISGTYDDIKNITPDDLYSAYEVFYQPSNMFIIISGNFKPLEALGIIKKNQSEKNFEPPKKIMRRSQNEPIKVDKTFEEKKLDISVPKAKISFKMSKTPFKDHDSLTLRTYLSAILYLKFGHTSDFSEKLTDGNLITWDIYPSREIRDDYIVISFVFESEYIEEVLELLKEELTKLEITDEEMNRFKKYSWADLIYQFNNNFSVSSNIMDDVLSYEKITTDILDFYESMNAKIANEIIDKFDLKNNSVFIIDRIDE